MLIIPVCEIPTNQSTGGGNQGVGSHYDGPGLTMLRKVE